MQSSNRFVDDLARVANGALSAAAGIREEFEQVIRQHLERYLADRDLVSREEYEAARAMAAKARSAQADLEARVKALEVRVVALEAERPKAPAPRKRKKVQEESSSPGRRKTPVKTPPQNADSET